MSPHAPLFVFAGGGTGGHLYPALAVAQAIREQLPEARFAIFSSQRAIDERILQAKDWTAIRQGLEPLSAIPWRWPGIYLSLRKAQRHCRELFSQQRPVAVLGTGGLASVPAVRVAAKDGIPSALLNPDVKPGKANRHLSRFADVGFAQFDITKRYLPAAWKVEVTGCPIRPEFLELDRASGIAAFGLDPDKKTLLVTGASQGSRSINEAALVNLDFFASHPDWQILHLTGEYDYQRVRCAYSDRGVCGTVLAYTDNMAGAFAASDLIVSRAGASTLGEITAVGKASILMPYPYHRDQHQRANAEFLAEQGAALLLDDKVDPERNGPALRARVEALCCDDARRQEIAQRARSLGRPSAARDIAQRLLDLAGIRRGDLPKQAPVLERESMKPVSASSR